MATKGGDSTLYGPAPVAQNDVTDGSISAMPLSERNRGLLASWWQERWLPALLLIAAVLGAYQPAWDAGFIWDDDAYVTANKLLTSPDGWRKIWFSLESPSQYCPLVYTTFRLERGLWGLEAAGYHWVNFLLHAANALLVWKLLGRLRVPGAWLAAALFAVHPVQVETVAWITERKNLLSLFFYLLALRQWIRFLDQEPKAWSRDYALALLFYCLALLSKTTACTLPAALLLVLWLQHRPITRARLLQVVPFVVLGLGMGLLTMWWERYHQGTAGPIFAFTWLERMLIASRAVWFYAGKLAWPSHLSFSYPRWEINISDPVAYAWLAAGIAAAALIFSARRFVGRGVETATAFYVATLCPLLGFIMLYTFRFTFVADHYQYVACIGPLALGAATVTLMVRRLKTFQPALEAGVCAGLVLALGSLTWRQAGVYASAETLWRHTIRENPGSFMAHNNLGTALLRQGQIDEALAHFQEVIRLQPDYEVAYYNLGHALLRKGQPDEAVVQFQKAVELKPEYANAHNNLGNLLARKGQWPEAIAHYETAVRLRPKNPDFANNLAWLLSTCPDSALRNGPKAVELAQRAEQLSGGKEAVYIATLAAAYAQSGQFEKAVGSAERSLAMAIRQRNSALARSLEGQLALYREGRGLGSKTATDQSQ